MSPNPKPEPPIIPTPPAEPLPLRSCREYLGRTLDERYRLERLLGRGGMGSVFFARHVAVGRPLAVKVLECRQAPTDGMTRIFREAQSAAAIGHPNIVDIIDVGVSPLGDPYLVMEYLEGEDLQSFMHREGPLSMASACSVLEPVLLGLSAAHRKGVVHRDLKPANIYLVRREDGSATVKLIDFGIAKFMDAAADGKITVTGALLGTPSYMSPEQAVGVIEVDERVDLYAVGVILYQLVAGRLPFEGANYNEILFRILNDEPRAPESIPGVARDAGAIIRKALCKNPSSRYQSAPALLDALKELDAWTARGQAFAQLAARIVTTTGAATLVGENAARSGSSPSPGGPPADAQDGADALPNTPVVAHRGSPLNGAVHAPDRATQADVQVIIGNTVNADSVAGIPSRFPGSPQVERTRVSQRDASTEAASTPVSPGARGSSNTHDPPSPVTNGARARELAPAQPASADPRDMTRSKAIREAAMRVRHTTNGGVTASPAPVEKRLSPLTAIVALAAAAIIGVGVWNRIVLHEPSGAAVPSTAESTRAEGILITVNGAPVGATIYYDGAPVSTNPFRTRASSVIVPLRIQAHGFEPFVATVVPSENTTVSVSMRRRAPSASRKSSATLPPHDNKPRSGRNLDRAPDELGSQSNAPRPASKTNTVPTSGPDATSNSTSGPDTTMQKSGRGTLYTNKFE